MNARSSAGAAWSSLRSVTMDDPRSKPIPTQWLTPLEQWCSTMRASGLRADTVTLRRSHIAQLSRAMGGRPPDISTVQLMTWLGSRQWSRETRRSHRSSQRSFFAHVGRLDLVEAIPAVRASDPAPRPIPEGALQAGLRSADDRTRLILRLAAELGMRRGEIARVHGSDVGEDHDGTILTVDGKGGKERTLPLSEGLAATIRLRSGGGFLFPGQCGGHLSPRRVGELATMALPAPWTLHKLRHRFATVVHEGCHDLLIVQEMLGHASLATTQRYVAVNRDRMREAARWAA